MKLCDYVQACAVLSATLVIVIVGAGFWQDKYHVNKRAIEDADAKARGLYAVKLVHPNATLGARALQLLTQPGIADAPVNLITIGGASRIGKSALANLLVGQQNAFNTGSGPPVTTGMDLYPAFWDWNAFTNAFVTASSADSFIPIGLSRATTSAAKDKPLIAVADSEGFGSRAESARVPVMLAQLVTCKVCVLMVPEDIEGLIEALNDAIEAAAVIPSLRRMFGQPMFGHLHVVIRTAYDAYTPDKEKELQARFFGRVEDATASPPDVRLRNALRAAVGAEFQTIYVHLMPPALDADAVEKAASNEPVRFHHYSQQYLSWFMSLAKLIIRQARTPRLLADGEVVTGRRLTNLTHHVLAAYETLSEGVKTPREIMADKVEELSQQVLTDVAAELVASMDENGMASDASPNLGLSHTHSVASVDPNMQCPTSLADMQTRVRAAALAEFQALLDATFEVKLLPHVRSQFVGYFEEDIASVLDVATEFMMVEASEDALQQRHRVAATAAQVLDSAASRRARTRTQRDGIDGEPESAPTMNQPSCLSRDGNDAADDEVARLEDSLQRHRTNAKSTVDSLTRQLQLVQAVADSRADEVSLCLTQLDARDRTIIELRAQIAELQDQVKCSSDGSASEHDDGSDDAAITRWLDS